MTETYLDDDPEGQEHYRLVREQGGFVLTTIFLDDETERTQIFSCIDKAMEWVDENKCASVSKTGFVDIPEYGNIPKEEMS